MFIEKEMNRKRAQKTIPQFQSIESALMIQFYYLIMDDKWKKKIEIVSMRVLRELRLGDHDVSRTIESNSR